MPVEVDYPTFERRVAGEIGLAGLRALQRSGGEGARRRVAAIGDADPREAQEVRAGRRVLDQVDDAGLGVRVAPSNSHCQDASTVDASAISRI